MSFGTIFADAPWLERGGGKIKRGADKHYRLLKTKDIPGVIRDSGVWTPAETCHLYLWVTNNFLEDGLWVGKELGFRYITCRTWAKDRMGLGRYYAGQTEQLLFFSRGPASVPHPKLRGTTLIGGELLPRGKEHSAKPAEAYTEAELVSPGPRLEMFAREPREGWTVWGDEV